MGNDTSPSINIQVCPTNFCTGSGRDSGLAIPCQCVTESIEPILFTAFPMHDKLLRIQSPIIYCHCHCQRHCLRFSHSLYLHSLVHRIGVLFSLFLVPHSGPCSNDSFGNLPSSLPRPSNNRPATQALLHHAFCQHDHCLRSGRSRQHRQCSVFVVHCCECQGSHDGDGSGSQHHHRNYRDQAHRSRHPT